MLQRRGGRRHAGRQRRRIGPRRGTARLAEAGPSVIACDKREAFAQGSESDEAIHISACGGMDCFASLAMTAPYRFDFFAVFFFVALRFFDVFFGTFLPLALASDSPIAIACLRLLTFLPERPLFRVPALRFFIARSTSVDAFFEYLRAIAFLRFSSVWQKK